ncbi:nitrogen fixation protein NifX [Sinorhizobium meliloti]|uniref:NifX iron-molybdenum cluster-binding protein n=1 Tax=Sinorhizobium meliloti CCNWSX0020 TaxID=1107881 RepID=H0G5D8_RHIML|nr:nitrogen fixation protein NifX [Sinorhizobium meliloti]AGA09722.1 nitrogen fixation protein NifX [Sinorhizobium meliloti GR4]ASP67225.1 nitrogen fixation protein NifX [Sinorhizobium meliloti]ASP81243.1 nitrogen fixation protein NifX [Sinorhizobium meliloti]ATA95320.1 nitrogen fixation protein NifX [Sinorhizobium meliloti]ATB01027.1 nitrogen fixation protein NifX [Sinorhizobium meliloti]
MISIRRLSLVSDQSQREISDRPVGALRIAIATEDMKGLNAHFGSAKRFAIYDVTAHKSQFMEAIEFDDASDESGRHRTEGDGRIRSRVSALKGCQLLFCLAIGGPSAAKVISAKIHPIKAQQAVSMSQVLSSVQTMLQTAPPPWLRKMLADAGAAKKRADFEDED